MPVGTAVGGISFASLWGEKHRFAVSREKLGEFLSGYCQLAVEDELVEDETDNYQSLGLSIGEVAMKKEMPLIVGMSFKWRLDEKDREDPSLYGEDFIKACAYTIQRLMCEKLEISPNPSELACVVLETRPWHTGDTTFVEMRFQFPYAMVDSGYQQRAFRLALIKKLRESKVLNRLEKECLGDWDGIVQELSDVVPMYRSKDDGVKCPLGLTHLYNVLEEFHIEQHDVKEAELEIIFKPSNHSFIWTKVVSGDILKNDIRHWLPLFLSINFWMGITKPKDAPPPSSKPYGGFSCPQCVTSPMKGRTVCNECYKKSRRKETKNALAKSQPMMISPASTPTRGSDSEMSDEEQDETKSAKPRDMLTELLYILDSKKRVADPASWKIVGKVFHTVSQGDDPGLDEWMKWTKEHGGDEKKCTSKWRKFLNNPYTVRAVAEMARKDNPLNYHDWHQAWCQSALTEGMRITNFDLAEAIARLVFLDNVYGEKTWFCTDKHRGLEEDKEQVNITNKMVKDVAKTYKRMGKDVAKMILDNPCGKDDNKQREVFVKQCEDVARKLGSKGFVTSTINALRSHELIYVKNINAKLNANPMLLGVANGVIEFDDETFVAREALLEDFVTHRCNVRYNHRLTLESPEVVAWLYYIKQIMVGDQHLIKFFRLLLSSFLIGVNLEKMIHFWLGTGDNAKTMTMKIIQEGMGPYAATVNEDMLKTSKAGGRGGLDPMKAQTRGTRVVDYPETDNGEMSGNCLKKQRGNDRQFARACNDNGGSFATSYKAVIPLNELPKIPQADKQVMKAVIILPFLAHFCEDAPADEKEQFAQRKFPLNKHFEAKVLPDLIEAFLWLAVQDYPTYQKEGLVLPQLSREYAENFWKAEDPYLCFIQEKISRVYKQDGKTPDDNVVMTSTDLYKLHFKLWYKDTYPSSKVIPDQPAFTIAMKRPDRLGPQNKSKWVGVKVQVAVEPFQGKQG